MGVCVHGLCLETVRELAKSADSSLGAIRVSHLVRGTIEPTCWRQCSCYAGLSF